MSRKTDKNTQNDQDDNKDWSKETDWYTQQKDENGGKKGSDRR